MRDDLDRLAWCPDQEAREEKLGQNRRERRDLVDVAPSRGRVGGLAQLAMVMALQEVVPKPGVGQAKHQQKGQSYGKPSGHCPQNRPAARRGQPLPPPRNTSGVNV